MAKQEANRAEAAARLFGEWADDWLESARSAKGGYDEKTVAGKERYVAYLKREFGSRLIPAIERPDVLLYLKAFEKAGKLETRDRVRSVGEKICSFADIEGTDHNPFSNLKRQLVENVASPRRAITNPGEVRTLFKTITAPFERGRFGDVIGHGLRFISLTVARPGEIAHAEWTEIDFDTAR